MIDIEAMDNHVLGDILENHTKEAVALMSVDEAFDAWLTFNGIIGYSRDIRYALYDIITSTQEHLRNGNSDEFLRIKKLFELE